MAEQLDPRFAALAETERIELVIGHVSARLASENATLERLVGEGARAIALGLVYVGDRLEDIRRELWNANNAKGIYERAGE